MGFQEAAHHLVAEVSRSNTVLEPRMRRSREDCVVGPELVEVFEALHRRLVDEHPAVLR